MMANRTAGDPRWKLLEHTADIRLEVRGATVEDLFVNAAEGFAELVAERRDTAPRREVFLSIEAETIDDLLVDWLREILYLHETSGFVCIAAEVTDLTQNALNARLRGRTKGLEERGPFVIKAVTYHDVSVEKTEGGFVARVVFDI